MALPNYTQAGPEQQGAWQTPWTQRKLGLMMPPTGWTQDQLADLAAGRNPITSPSKPKFR